MILSLTLYNIIEPIFYHHNPLKGGLINEELTCLLHISDILSWRLFGKSIDIDPKIYDILELTPRDLNNVIENIN